jgi:hypothetical protein
VRCSGRESAQHRTISCDFARSGASVEVIRIQPALKNAGATVEAGGFSRPMDWQRFQGFSRGLTVRVIGIYKGDVNC